MRLSYEVASQVCRSTPGANPRVTSIDKVAQLPPSVERAGSGFFDAKDTGSVFDTVPLQWAYRDGKETLRLKSRIAHLDKELGAFLALTI